MSKGLHAAFRELFVTAAAETTELVSVGPAGDKRIAQESNRAAKARQDAEPSGERMRTPWVDE